MVYKKNGKAYQIPDTELTALQLSLNISRPEALDVWLDDHDIETNAEAVELDTKAKGKVKADGKNRKKSTTPRKPPTRKANPEKQWLIANINTLLQGFELNGKISNVTIANAERSIDFEMGGQSFTLNLVGHRKK